MGKRLALAGLIAGGGALAWWLSRSQASNGGGFSFAPSSPLIEPPAMLGVGQFVESYLQGFGLTGDQARGVAAGVWAESQMDPTAINPKSGAFGIGQWLGTRKAELFARYGPAPTLLEQLDFLAWELGGGDRGGAAVLSQDTPTDTLNAYIRRFMRPGDGTAGDLARGAQYLG